MSGAWHYAACKCGDVFYTNSSARCVKCRAFYWMQAWEGVPAEKRVERWEANEISETLQVLSEV